MTHSMTPYRQRFCSNFAVVSPASTVYKELGGSETWRDMESGQVPSWARSCGNLWKLIRKSWRVDQILEHLEQKLKRLQPAAATRAATCNVPRVRVLLPPPQVTLQPFQGDQSAQPQSWLEQRLGSQNPIILWFAISGLQHLLQNCSDIAPKISDLNKLFQTCFFFGASTFFIQKKIDKKNRSLHPHSCP